MGLQHLQPESSQERVRNGSGTGQEPARNRPVSICPPQARQQVSSTSTYLSMDSWATSVMSSLVGL